MANYQPPRARVVRRPGVTSLQAKTKEDAGPLATKYACSTCQITYTVPYGTPAPIRCPLCEANEVIVDLRATILSQGNELARVHKDSERLRAHVDVHLAMRQAMDIMREDELVWLKAALYRWRADKAHTALKVKHQGTSGRRRAKAVGFTLLTQDGAEELTPGSIGGAALVAEYEEAIRQGGPVFAMQILDRAVSKWMPGGQ